MNFFKRGLLSIKRNPVKTVVLLLLVFVLGCVISAAVSVYNGVNATEQSVYDRASTVDTVELDYDNLFKLSNEEIDEIQMSSEYRPTVEAMDSIGALPQVEYYDYTFYEGWYDPYVTETGEPVKGYVDAEWHIEEGIRTFDDDGNEIDPYDLTFKIYSITGTAGSEPIHFKTGVLKLVDGRFFNDKEIAGESYGLIISRQVANKNNLKLGSKITVPIKLYDMGHYWEEEYVLDKYEFQAEVVGIFDFDKKGMISNNGEEIYNKVYSTNATLYFMQEKYIEMYLKQYPDTVITDAWHNFQYENYYMLKSPKDVEAFEEAAQQYLPEYNTITTTSDFYAAYVAPLETVKDLAKGTLIAAAVAVVVILGLAVTLFLRSRRGEMGIYLALGEKKGKVMGQVVTEVLIVAVIAITCSLFVGRALSRQISDRIISEQITTQMAELDDARYNYNAFNVPKNVYSRLHNAGYSTLVDGEYVTENYDVSMGGRTVLMFYGIGIAAVVIATAVSMIYIIALDPKKILMTS